MSSVTERTKLRLTRLQHHASSAVRQTNATTPKAIYRLAEDWWPLQVSIWLECVAEQGLVSAEDITCNGFARLVRAYTRNVRYCSCAALMSG